jgi:hypothetical protein
MSEDARDALRRKVAATMESAFGMEPNFTRMLAEDVNQSHALKVPRTGAEAVAAIQHRAWLHRQAIAQVQSLTLQRLPPNSEKAMRNLQEQHVRLLAKPISEDLAARWADVDVRDFRALKDPARKKRAGDVIERNGQVDARYGWRYSETAPDVALQIDSVKAAALKFNPAAKELPMSHASPRESTDEAPRTRSPAEPRHDSRFFTEDQIRRVAEAFVRHSPVEALRKHPELAGSYASMAVIAKKAEADQLTLSQKEIVEDRVRENILGAIYGGVMPKVRTHEHVYPRPKDSSRDHEPER